MFLNCGLDEYPVLEEPVSGANQPLYTNTDNIQNYFNFTCVKSDMAGEFTFLGTQVYYRIYNNHSDLDTDTSILNNLSQSTNKYSSADRLLSYKYVPLCEAPDKNGLLIGGSGAVNIRLSDFSDDYPAKIEYSGHTSVPLRNISTTESGSFNFGQKTAEGKNQFPVDGDEDFKYSSTPDNEYSFYVAMYAVAVARDVSFQTFYSNILYLGSVTISKNNSEN